MSTLSLRATLELIDRVTRPLNAINRATEQATTALRTSSRAVHDLERVVGDVHSFNALQNELTQTAAKLSQATAREHQLAAAIAATNNPTQAQIRGLEAAQRATARLTARQTQQTTQLGTLQTRLAAAGVNTQQMGQAEVQLDQRVRMANLRLEEQRRVLERLQAQQQRLTAANQQYARSQELQGKISGVGGSAAMGAAIGAAAMSVPIKAFASAEDARTQLKVALMGVGGVISADYEKINQLATRLGDRLPGTTADFQNMMTMLVRQGIPAQNILGGVGESAAYLAVQLKMAPDAAAEFAAKMQDATRTTSKDMLGLMDLIQRGFYSGVDQNNMLQAFKNLGPVMDMIKQKGLDGSKALAPFVVMLDQAGMKGESGGNAIRKIVTGGFNTDNINSVLNAMNKKSGSNLKMNFTDGKGEFGGIDNMMAQLAKLKALTTEDRQSVLKDMFGTDAEVNMVLSTLIEKGKAGYDEVVRKMQAQADLQTRVNLQLGTLKNLWDAASGTFTNAMATFGEAISPELKALTQWIGDVSAGLSAWAKENPETANWVMKIAGGIVLLLGAVAAISGVLLAVLGPMAALRLAFIMLNLSMSVNPIFLLLLALAGLAYVVYQNWDAIKAFGAGIRDWLVGGMSSAIEWCANLYNAMVNYVSGGIESAIGAFMRIGGVIFDFFTAPLRAAIDACNLLIQGLNRLPGVKIPPIPQIQTYSTANQPIQAMNNSPILQRGGRPVTINQAPTTFIVNGAGDPKTTAQHVNKILDDRDRKQASKLNSRLGDKD